MYSRATGIAPTETVNEKVPTTGEYATIVSAARNDDASVDAVVDAVVDGRFGIDGAVRTDAAETKKIESAVVAIVAPDREETKFLSIRLAIAVAHQLPNSSTHERLATP